MAEDWGKQKIYEDMSVAAGDGSLGTLPKVPKAFQNAVKDGSDAKWMTEAQKKMSSDKESEVIPR